MQNWNVSQTTNEKVKVCASRTAEPDAGRFVHHTDGVEKEQDLYMPVMHDVKYMCAISVKRSAAYNIIAHVNWS